MNTKARNQSRDVDLNPQVVAIYKCLRNCLLNQKYYGRKLHVLQRRKLLSEVAIAIGTGGSAVAALTFWKTGYGVQIWGFLTALAAFLTTLKPVLRLDKDIERYQKLFLGYTEAYSEMDRIRTMIASNKTVSAEVIRRHHAISKQVDKLSLLDDPHPSPALLKACRDLVNSQISVNDLWWPECHASRLQD